MQPNPTAHPTGPLANSLTDSIIHVWYLNMADTSESEARVEECLSAGERERAARFRSAKARDGYVKTRGRLRNLLGAYLDRDPLEFEFAANEYGKPRLKDTRESQGLVFNISHSGDCAVLGFALDTALGIDIEAPRRHRNLEGLAAACLAPMELEWWNRLEPERRADEFTRLWVCKEAFVKATGRGLALGLGKVGVQPDFGGYGSIPPEYGMAGEWRLHEWVYGANRVALAYRGAERGIGVFECGDGPEFGRDAR